ncbi:MAG: hypothetical protein KKB13_28795 [Chloroflexi bacterium]|nr:hypothetical protein [Chloroflexota bacterium]
MHKHVWATLLLGLGALLGLILLAGCAAPDEIQPVPPTPTLVIKSTITAGQPTPVVPGETVRFPIPAKVNAPMSLADNTNCITCHSDEETLKSVAEPVTETEPLSEGEG